TQGRNAVPGTVSGTLWVTQKPPQKRVAPGAAVALECCVVATRPWLLLRLDWHRDGERRALCSSRLDPAATANVSCGARTRLAWRPPCATLHLRAALPADSGRYVCRATLEI
ncbi:TMIG2 protein, partial [Nothocercus nigrocapillus]|nr:TMIG2 protein [Nothocercus nigrocapillus]